MQRLTSLTLHLKPSGPVEGGRRPGSLGPYLQGALMERVDTAYAALLHQLPFNPYSQYCYWEGESLVWRINAMNEDAAQQIIEPVRAMDVVQVRAIHMDYEVVHSSLETMSQKALLDVINEPGTTKAKVRFLTPTAFKSKGSYVNMPSVRLILQNLLMHYGQVYDNDKEGYEETIEYVDQYVRILAYNLRSCPFGHVGAGSKSIPGFVGTATLGLRGPEMALGLARMLLRFGEFSGVGIKTSMGMGGFTCSFVDEG